MKHVLIEIKNLIQDPSNWTQGTHARNMKGFAVEPTDPDASQWCLDGALAKVTNVDNDLLRASSRTSSRSTTTNLTPTPRFSRSSTTPWDCPMQKQRRVCIGCDAKKQPGCKHQWEKKLIASPKFTFCGTNLSRVTYTAGGLQHGSTGRVNWITRLGSWSSRTTSSFRL